MVALANLGASLTQVFASADRVLDLLDEQPVTADVTDGTDTAFAGAAAEHVNFAYADEVVLHDLSLTIPEKKIVGITGRSGSGKSTFLRLLMRFWDVSSGSIRWRRGYPPREHRRPARTGKPCDAGDRAVRRYH